MENETKATSIFDALGVKDEHKADLGGTPELVTGTDGNEGNVNPENIAPAIEEATFKASDLKAIFGDFECIDLV